MTKLPKQALDDLRLQLSGELHSDHLMKALYATDASVYRMLPLAVAFPKNKADLKLLIDFAKTHQTSLIPRTAGTSLAGQCVGKGIVVDVSKHFNKIIDINEREKTATVQPGVVRDELNQALAPFGLFFGPNTSTSNRCMIGGMVGNNSSGTTSIQYGVTRDKVLELKTFLSDGSEVVFSEMASEGFENKTKLNTLEGHIYRTLYAELSPEAVQNEIIAEFPKPEIHRRNTGYAIDELIKTEIFSQEGLPFNMCKLLTGSEGTLAFTTQITLKLDQLPPKEPLLVAAHFRSIADCLNAVSLVMEHDLYTCEMMDKTILDLTKHNKKQEENRQFVEGDPEAILMCEIRASSKTEAAKKAGALLASLQQSQLSYANPVLSGDDIDKAIELRKAGLGLLGNLIGDQKTAACIEDTAVALPDLANYVADFSKLMESYKQKPVYYAHAGAGELHLRPILNLKKKSDVVFFRKITTEVAHLVKSYKGSMSGEHGDGIVRAEFIPLMIGQANYQLLKQIKSAFDPHNIFNPGKITDALPMDENLRYVPDRIEPEVETLMDFSSSLGILREAEKCNGSGDCRKLPQFGGTMCPSFRATRDEKDSTRARANALREILTQSDKKNKFDHEELKDVFDLCLSCKACATECPSSVDVASLKAEFQYQYQKANGISLRTKLFAYNNSLNGFGSYVPRLTNFLFSNVLTSAILKKSFGIASERSLPLLSTQSLYKWFHCIENQNYRENYKKTIYFFVDEFTNHLDANIGKDAIELLTALDYEVKVIDNEESGRAFISKGLLEKAKDLANKNIALFKDKVSAETPLIGIEPSAILGFKDDYLRLANDKTSAENIAKHCYLIEDFIAMEIDLGHIGPDQFSDEIKTIKFHGHCHQKALTNQLSSFKVLNLPKNYKVSIIPSGCCGMAGSFGYEKEHYELSMQIGEQTLFPAVRKASASVVISANGTSCRHQIKDGTSREALHPITVLRRALV
ncbi:FAD-binding protein [Subsaximicrobium wynnwilliamsii]|uniref:FAD-binding protein n=1 Tax=Subsaximicrobium wynnwilliamsii TaxID=291179 RepID=A0A5C6ZG38_9FLAO|nr:FAD-binding and (Fe-S)-binding domain-containing protein [Subsaximicrobium wynnwilliamsii]TXD82919.1 FAD-binding protein [Subsaximicrobium wynnwilliamsii]TXD88640.1 FAD-binding protein [Subsaximicrobium wynnwilliamsii]TXE02733.1 FAD-binding protein [Subsaximicrobium wynnwilliamsii]